MWLRFATAAREMCHKQRQIQSHTQNQGGVGGLFGFRLTWLIISCTCINANKYLQKFNAYEKSAYHQKFKFFENLNTNFTFIPFFQVFKRFHFVFEKNVHTYMTIYIKLFFYHIININIP